MCSPVRFRVAVSGTRIANIDLANTRHPRANTGVDCLIVRDW